MIISVNLLKQFTAIDVPIDELATLIGARLVEIEKVIDLGAKYKDVVVARVAESKRMEGSDHLNVVKLDDGAKTLDIERDENGYIQVVCGAANVREGMLVAWLPPNTVVPETYGKPEPFILSARKLRGVVSNGMIASPRELDLYDEHAGILELDKDIALGESFAKAYEFDDYLLDIENKSLTHRPDCFGIIGFAREVAAIQGRPFKTPDWLAHTTPAFSHNQTTIETPRITIDNPELSARYQAVVLSDADGAATSPLQIQTYLSRVGVRPINAVVDVTNYLMLLTGQPMHAFDYDKVVAISGGKADIHVRAGRDNERLALLDGRTITLTSDDIVIAAGETAIGLAGAMGGAATEIDKATKTIILESATFNLYNLRATQMRHGIFSEAITRFTKGQPPELTAPVLATAVQLMAEYAGAKQVSDVAESYPNPPSSSTIKLAAETVNGVLGTNHTIEDMLATLQNAEFAVTMTCDDKAMGEVLCVEAPYWRADIHIPEDVIEEIGRLEGFDSIKPTLPSRDFTAIRPTQFDHLRSEIRRTLVRAGVNEVLTYSFVHGDILKRAAQKPEDSYRIVNAISPELQYYRQTLTPSLLSAVYTNSKQGYDQFALFELNKVHPKRHGLNDEGVPEEVDMLALTVAGKKPQAGAPYYHAQTILTFLGRALGLELMYAPIETDPNYPVTAPFEYRRSAFVTDKKTDTFLGIVGEYKKSVARAFKLPSYVAGFEVSSPALLEATQKLTSSYTPLSRYPSMEHDICFQVAREVAYRAVADSAASTLTDSSLEISIIPIDIYQPTDGLTKNITLRLKLTAHDRTLTSDEASAVATTVITNVVATTKATVI